VYFVYRLIHYRARNAAIPQTSSHEEASAADQVYDWRPVEQGPGYVEKQLEMLKVASEAFQSKLPGWKKELKQAMVWDHRIYDIIIAVEVLSRLYYFVRKKMRAIVVICESNLNRGNY